MLGSRLCSLAFCSVLALTTGCDKLKSAVGVGGEGGVTTSANALPFVSGFEGEVGILFKGKAGAGQNAAANGPQVLTLETKGDKVRLDLPPSLGADKLAGGTGYALLNTPEKKLYFVMDAQKQAILIDLNKAGEQLKGITPPSTPRPGAPPGPPPAPPKITKTGKMETVAGYSCEDWTIEQEAQKALVCVAQQGASFFHLPITGIPTEHAWMAELLDGKHFPLRFIAYAKDGVTEESRIEVTRIEKKAIPAARLDVPPGYKIIDLAQMLQGLGGLGGPPGGLPPGRPPRH